MLTRNQKNEAELHESALDIPGEVPVLIVGGGPVGLSSSLLLSFHGVRSLLVEQHPGTSTYPKSRLINARTMEIFRELGIEQAIRAIAIPHTHDLVITPSLAGKEILIMPAETVNPEPVKDWSPTWGTTITQEIFEPVLLAQARQHTQAQIRFGMQLAALEQQDEFVLATLVHRPTGRVTQVRARYLIGADGSHSTVRTSLGIRMLGEPVLGHYVSILFHADLSPWVRGREINIASIVNPQSPGLLLYNGGDAWRYTAYYFPDRGQRPEDFTPEHCISLIRIAVGAPDLAVQIDNITPWTDGAQVAEHFSSGRIFLAGDANHLMSPMGGFGMNVGIQDAHNLAWKLAAVLQGWGMPALLESYGLERQPASRVVVEQMRRNRETMRSVVTGGGVSSPAGLPTQNPPKRPELGREHGLVFGAFYESTAVMPDGTAPVQVEDPVHEYTPNAHPGSRAPHVWVEREGKRISTLDLFGHEFILLAGNQGQDWYEVAKAVSRVSGIPVHTFQVGHGYELEDPDNIWAKAYGVGETGAVLVRPDGYVAWRCASSKADPMAELETALIKITANQSIRKYVEE